MNRNGATRGHEMTARQRDADMTDEQARMDAAWMKRALSLAKKGIGTTHPNPRVGAVVVNHGVVVGEGWHRRAGEPHAEALALAAAGHRARGGTLYVTLEPCSARGRTPACTDAILRAGIRRVVYASADPNPAMAGGGELLRVRDVEVVGGVMREEADALNAPFFHFIRTNRPRITAKAAISLDGRLATRTGHSRWISGEQARRHAHRLRARSDAIIIGAGTLIADDPELTVRDARLLGDPPLRVVMCFETPPFNPGARILQGDAPVRFYVRGVNEHTARWREAGVEIGRATSLIAALRHLAADGRLDVLLEGGGQLHAAFFEARLTDHLVLYQAPLLIGGRDAVSLWPGMGAARVDEAPRLVDVRRRKLGEDQLIEGRVVYPGASGTA